MKKNEHIDIDKTIAFLDNELKNFQEIATRLKPGCGDTPHLPGIDIYGKEIPFNSVVGGDHIIYIDFNRRYHLDYRIEAARKAGLPEVVQKLEANKYRAGILLADAAGHNITDALLAAMLHQAFLTGVQYELKEKGEITGELFEVLNTRFFNSSSLSKFITLIYGEIYEGGRFRFLNAGHPPPVIFSNRMDKLINICKQRVAHYPPIGTLPPKDDIDPGRHFSRLGYKKKYSVNQINLMGTGDILLLYTDGFSEHSPDMETFFLKHRLEGVLQKIKHGSARDIFCGIKEEMFKFAEAGDDISFVVIKRV